MPAATTAELVLPATLEPAARQALLDGLYAVHCQIFDGVEKSAFAKYVIDSKAAHTIIQLHKNSEGAIVGYCAFHRFEQRLSGKLTAIVRMEAGSLRAYRGSNRNTRFVLGQIARYKRRHPLRPIYYLGTLVHPSSYAAFAKYAEQIWPAPDREPAPEIRAFMAELARTFELEPVDPGNPLVVHVGWRTRDSEAERSYWRSCDKPTARFFVQQNPHYSQGQGLMTLVPIRASGLARTMRLIIGDQVSRRRDQWRMAIQRLPLINRTLGARDIERRLKQTALFAKVGAADLAEVVKAAETLTLAAGTYVFRAGDMGNELYVVASGAVYVLAERDGQELIIDQLPAGAMFGEIAMLGGEARGASIRTATKTTLIRVHRAALLNLMRSHEQLSDAIWEPFAARRFHDMVSCTVRFAGLSRQERLDWFARGRQEPVAARGAIEVSEPWLFLLAGTIEVEDEQMWLSVRAPALIDVKRPLRMIASQPSRIVRLPAWEPRRS